MNLASKAHDINNHKVNFKKLRPQKKPDTKIAPGFKKLTIPNANTIQELTSHPRLQRQRLLIYRVHL